MSRAEGYVCRICRKRGSWTKEWSWYGSYASLDHLGEKGCIVVCSETCAGKITARMKRAIPRVKNYGYGCRTVG